MGKSPVAGYLDIEGILAVAKEQGVDAIHPGAGPCYAGACRALASPARNALDPGLAGLLGMDGDRPGMCLRRSS